MDPLLKKDGLMIPGNGRPTRGLLVGSMDLTLELTLCAVQVQTQRARRLKELYVQNAHEHNAQWALVGGVQNWHCSGQVTAEENTIIIGAAIRCAPKSRS